MIYPLHSRLSRDSQAIISCRSARTPLSEWPLLYLSTIPTAVYLFSLDLQHEHSQIAPRS